MSDQPPTPTDAAADIAAGIAAFRAGDRQQAIRLLYRATRSDPHNQRAWLWLAAAAPHERGQRTCLQRVLAIDSDTLMAARARAALARLEAPPAPAHTAPPTHRPAPRFVAVRRPWWRRHGQRVALVALLVVGLLAGGLALWGWPYAGPDAPAPQTADRPAERSTALPLIQPDILPAASPAAPPLAPTEAAALLADLPTANPAPGPSAEPCTAYSAGAPAPCVTPPAVPVALPGALPELDALLYQPDDLPFPVQAGPVSHALPARFGERRSARALAYQTLQTGPAESRRAYLPLGEVLTVLYAAPDDVAAAYDDALLLNIGAPADPHTGALSVAQAPVAVGERAMAFMRHGASDAGTPSWIVFTRCQAFVHVLLLDMDTAGLIGYARRLDERLTPLACGLPN